MESAKTKLIMAIGHLMVVVLLLSTATYAFLMVSKQVRITNIQITMVTTDIIEVRSTRNQDNDFGSVIHFEIPEEFEMMTLTSVDGHRFFFENKDEYFWGDEPIYGYIYEDFEFFSPSKVDVYLANEDILTTTEVEESKREIINALRISFVPFTIDEEGNKIFEEGVIYARADTETQVSQFPGIDEVIVESFTELGIEGGNKIFELEAWEVLNVRICIWLEGNDEQADSRVAEATFSMFLKLIGERLEDG